MNGLTLEQTKLLLASAAFHDSGREGLDGHNNHAEASSIQIQKYLEENPENPFGITKENLGMLQVAIHYHEYDEPNFGKLDEKELQKLCERYKVDESKFEDVKILSALLKDADALDRGRFLGDALEAQKLHAQYLHSESAKNKDMINYANSLNTKVIFEKYTNILVKYYGVQEKITRENVLGLLRRERKKRVDLGLESKFSSGLDLTKKEAKLSLDELLKIYGLDKVKSKDNKLEVLKKLYKEQGSGMSEIIQMGQAIEQDLKKEKMLEKGKTEKLEEENALVEK